MEKFAIDFIAFFYALINNFDLKKITKISGLIGQLSIGLALLIATKGKAGKAQAMAVVIEIGHFIDETRKQITPEDRKRASNLLNGSKKVTGKIVKKAQPSKATKKVAKKAVPKKAAKKATKKAPKNAAKSHPRMTSRDWGEFLG